MQTVKFNGKEWPIQYVLVDDEYLMVGSEKLEKELLNDETPVNEDAEAIDEMIYCYVPDKQFKKNEVQLTKYVEKNFF